MNPEIVFPHLGIEIDHLSRVAFSVFGVEVYYYGLLIAIAVLVGSSVVLYEAKRTEQNPDDYTDFLIFAIIAGVIGARLYYVAFSWDLYKDDPMKIFAIREGGLAIYGAIIATTITAFIYTRVKKLSFRIFADTIILCLPIGQAIGRWGNFFNREAFGGYTDSLFAMRYLASQVSYIPEEVAKFMVTMPDGTEYIQVHPTFLYESALCIVIFIFLFLYRKHKKFNGELAAMYFATYGLGRFFIEGLRTDQLFLWQTGIPVSQLLSLGLCIVATIFIIYGRVKASRDAVDGLGSI